MLCTGRTVFVESLDGELAPQGFFELPVRSTFTTPDLGNPVFFDISFGAQARMIGFVFSNNVCICFLFQLEPKS